MTKDKFKENLEGAVESLIRMTKELCFNSFSLNYRFQARPNIETVDPHLDEEEIAFHNQLVNIRDKYLTNHEVSDLLWTNSKVPLWINTSVLESSDSGTTIELLTSRRLRNENELNKIVDQFPPFHIQVPLPHNRIDGEKFDINWRTAKRKKMDFGNQ